jgi:hypothetical protein
MMRRTLLADLRETSVALQPWDEARVVIVTEPAKFRPVTCGNPLIYTTLQPLQKYLLSEWKLSPFSTMLDEDLTGRVRDVLTKYQNVVGGNSLPGGNSGDYEAATDQLNVDVTHRLIRWLVRNAGVPRDIAELIERTTGNAMLIYPDGDRILQQSGQLMGHVLSFPLLCVANLATYLAAQYPLTCVMRGYCDPNGTKLERDNEFRFNGYRRSDWTDEVIVNGDDIFFAACDVVFERWANYSRSIGLVPSLGKNYWTPRAALIKVSCSKSP